MSFAVSMDGEVWVFVRGRLVWKRWSRPGMGAWSCLFQTCPSHTYARPESRGDGQT